MKNCSALHIGFIYPITSLPVGLDRTVVSMVHCGCIDPGSIPGLDNIRVPFAFPLNVLQAYYQSSARFQFVYLAPGAWWKVTTNFVSYKLQVVSHLDINERHDVF